MPSVKPVGEPGSAAGTSTDHVGSALIVSRCATRTEVFPSTHAQAASGTSDQSDARESRMRGSEIKGE